MKISCIIVEDEPAARKLLEEFVSKIPALEMVASCKNALEATEMLGKTAVQLIFLDINMPRLSGLAFYKSLPQPPYVIFTTAYPQYAIEGFELDAVDYLLKPFPFERFLKAVNKAISRCQNNRPQGTGHDFLLLKSDKKLYRISLEEIMYLEALGDYVKIHCVDKSLMVHDTFQRLLTLLPLNEFVRVHKSFAIALSKLDHIEGNRISIGDEFVPIGQTYRAEFLNLINP